MERFDLYIKSSIPSEYHYSNNDRVGAMTLVAREGYVFQDAWRDMKTLNEEHKRAESVVNTYGFAGYNNQLDSMQSIVIMQGPDIQTEQV